MDHGLPHAFVSNLALDQFEPEGELVGLQSTAGWTYGVLREDIKQAVDFAKHTAKTRKLFMAGRSRGGSQLFIYAAKYESDLKGMNGLDGGPIYQGVENLEQQQSRRKPMMLRLLPCNLDKVRSRYWAKWPFMKTASCWERCRK